MDKGKGVAGRVSLAGVDCTHWYCLTPVAPLAHGLGERQQKRGAGGRGGEAGEEIGDRRGLLLTLPTLSWLLYLVFTIE